MLSREHRLLLEACLRVDERAIEAWRDWCAATDLDHLDRASERLLPLLDRNLRARGVREPILRRYQGVRRYHWCRNQKLLARLSRLAAVLAERSVPLVALGDLALILAHEDAGLRPTTEVALLVRPEHAPVASEALRDAGHRRRPARAGRESPTRPIRWSASEGSASIELHVHPFRHRPSAEIDELFRSRARPANGSTAAALLVPEPTDLLLHLVHRASFGRLPPIHWLPDVATVVRGSTIDEERLAADAAALGLGTALRETFLELADVVELELPSGRLARPAGEASPSRERWRRAIARLRAWSGFVERPRAAAGEELG